MSDNNRVLIFGATGNIGGAATRELLRRGWHVRAVTRNPEGGRAQTLRKLGAEVVRADMDDRPSLEAAFAGMRRVFSVQNWTKNSVESEIRQGKLVADVAHVAGVLHLVYGSAGTGKRDTGVPHFDSKIEVEDHLRGLGVPFTILRPTPFMELLTEKEFFPALGTWGVEPRIVGWDTPKPWVSVRDLGVAIANCFSAPDRWIGEDIALAGDVKSLAECQAIFKRVDGRSPLRIPLPTALFRRMAGNELLVMWRWLKDWVEGPGHADLRQLVESSRALAPDLLDMETWLHLKRREASPPWRTENQPISTRS